MNLGKENEYQEFKEGLGQLDKGLKSISAMLNKHGEAVVYFGVNDDGDVCGVMIGKNTLMDIRNRIRDKIEPRIYPQIEECSDGERSYIKVSAKGFDIPYSLMGDITSGWFLQMSRRTMRLCAGCWFLRILIC